MNTNGLYISAESFALLPMSVQSTILKALFGGSVSTPDGAVADILESSDDSFAQLSPAQAREFYLGCGDKTKKAIEVIAKGKDRTFHIADIAKELGVTPGSLRGVWGGLTRRLTTITGDSDAYLIKWEGHEPVWDANDELVDQVGEVSELTYRSFRRLLVK